MRDFDKARRAGLLIFVSAMVAYAAALGGTFVYDDFHSVRDNPAIRSLANLASFFWDLDAFSATDARMYRPVLLVTLAMDHAVGGGAAFAFKATDVGLHAAAAVLVFSLARALRGGFAPSVFAGLLFAVHPLASEAVSYVSSRSDQLVAVGALLAMRMHVASMHGVRGAWIGVAVATAVACGAKESGVVVPALLLAMEGARARRRGLDVRGAVLRTAGPIAVVLGYLGLRRVLFGVATVAVPPLAGGADAASGAGRDLLTQWTTMGGILPRFVAQVAVPVGLSADPSVPFGASPTDVAVIAGWVAIGALTLFGLRAPRRRPGAFVGTCAAWAIAMPWVLIPLNSPANEHRFYGSLAMLCVVLGATVPASRLRARTVRLVAASVLLLFAGVSTARCVLFHDARRVWADVLVDHPTSAAALRGMAQAHQDDARAAFEAGDDATGRDEVRIAMRYAYRALGVRPRNLTVLKGLVGYEMALGPVHGLPLVAVVLSEGLVERRPNDPFARILSSRALAQAAVSTGELRFAERADRVAMSVLEVADAKGLVFRVAAEAWRAVGDGERALGRLDEAIARGLDHWTVRIDRAEVLKELGRTDEAIAEARRVLATAPFQARARSLIEESVARPRPR